MRRSLAQMSLIPALLLYSACRLGAQAVSVTARLDSGTLVLGDTTTLHIYAQVIPSLRTNTDRIFSWYVDVLNTNDAVACVDYSAMVKAASDNDPLISSIGFDQGSNRVGIYDTFLNLPGAGRDAPVELMAVPITARIAGRTQFSVRHGSGVPELSQDFIVAPSGGGNFMFGGDYSTSGVTLQVISPPPCNPILAIALDSTSGTLPMRLRLTFAPCSGYDHTIEYRDSLNAGPGWQPLAGAPHNSGSLIVSNAVAHRFFRIRTTRTPACKPELFIAPEPNSGAAATQFRLSFTPCMGYDHTIEYLDNLGPQAIWQPLAGSPHNSGTVLVSNNQMHRFFRLRSENRLRCDYAE